MEMRGKKGVALVLEYQSNSKSYFYERGRTGLELLQSVPEDFTEIMVQYKEKISQKDQMVDFEKETLRW